MKIIYEDVHLLVCHKPAGIAVQTSRVGEPDMESICKKYLKGSYVGVIHRLDQPVEGLLVFAKTPQATKELSKQLAANEMQKVYRAYVYGEPKEKDICIHYITKKAGTNLSEITTKEKGKLSELSYQVIEQRADGAIIEILLKTGRHHQIRVQMAALSHPLLGDNKYGTEESKVISKDAGITSLALCAVRLSFLHPQTKKKLTFQIEPEGSWANA